MTNTEAWRDCLTEETKTKIRDRIFTDLHNSEAIHKKVDGICYRNNIQKETKIAEDVFQETFMHLSRRKSDEIIEMYLDNPDRILGLAVTIAIRKGVLSHSQYPDYPKHSLARFILFTSNLNQRHTLSPKDSYCGSDDDSHGFFASSEYQDVLHDHSQDINPEVELWRLIKEELTEDENIFLEQLLNEKKGRGRYKVVTLGKIDNLKQRIKSIIEKHKINI